MPVRGLSPARRHGPYDRAGDHAAAGRGDRGPPRRLEEAGRDPSSIDITFSNPAGGDPASDAFDADAHLEGLAELAALGVTWVQVALPGDSLAHAVETVQRYGRDVIAHT